MNRLVFAFASFALAMSCTTNPPIVPEPPSATTGTGGFGGNGGAGGDASSSSTASNSSGSASSSGSLPGDGSGTRLKRYAYTSADGAVIGQFKLYDPVLQIDCQPLPVPGGTRCVSYGHVITGMYHDASCSLDAIGLALGCVPNEYATKLETTGTCPPSSVFRIFPIGAKQPAGYYKSGNVCTPLTAAQSAETDVYSIGPEVDYTQFAAMTLGHE
jgi:hypothetical protein